MRCKYCGEEFTPTFQHRKYCCDDCAIQGERENTVLRVRRYRKKYGGNKTKHVGTGYLGQHRSTDFTEEYKSIQKEMKYLKLCNNRYTYK